MPPPSLIPTSQVAPDAQWYDSPEAAAHAATRSGKADVEQAGFIVSRADGKFAFSTPVSQRDHDNFAFRARIQPEHKLAAIYHNHPGNDPDANFFSPRDVSVANKLKIPSFIRINQSGTLRRYTPGKSSTFTAPGWGSKEDGLSASNGEVVPEPTASQSSPSVPAQLPDAGGVLSRAVAAEAQ